MRSACPNPSKGTVKRLQDTCCDQRVHKALVIDRVKPTCAIFSCFKVSSSYGDTDCICCNAELSCQACKSVLSDPPNRIQWRPKLVWLVFRLHDADDFSQRGDIVYSPTSLEVMAKRDKAVSIDIGHCTKHGYVDVTID